MDEDIKELSTWEEAETLLKVKGASLRRINKQEILWQKHQAEQSAQIDVNVEVAQSISTQTSKKPLWILVLVAAVLAAVLGAYFYQEDIMNYIPWEMINGNENG